MANRIRRRSVRIVARTKTESTLLLLHLPLLVAAHVSLAQDHIDTNRPAFSSSPYVVSPGLWQIETGIQYQRQNEQAGSTTLTLPYATLRYGALDDIELDFSWDGVSRFRSGGDSSTGISDASVGIKIQVTGDQARTVAAFFADLSVPLGDDALSSNSWDPSIGVAWAHSSSLNWAGTAQITRHGGDYRLDNGVKLNFFTSATSRAFVEWEANVPDSGGSIHTLNGGYLWLPESTVQFDVNASLGLNRRAADYALGLGFSCRF